MPGGYIMRDGSGLRTKAPPRSVVRVMFVGDSKAVGLGDPPLGSPSVTICDGYRLALYQLFLERYGIRLLFVGPNSNASTAEIAAIIGGNHAAVSGTKIADITPTLASRINTYGPDVLVADTITNDVDALGASVNITSDYNGMLNAARGATNTVLPIVAVKPIPLLSTNGLAGMSTAYSQFDSLISGRGDSKIIVADMSGMPTSTAAGMYSVRADSGFQDAYHLGKQGYRYAVNNYLAPALRQVACLS